MRDYQENSDHFPPGASVVDVNSSNIERMAYCGGSDGRMFVEFQNGAVYRYVNVDPVTYLAILQGGPTVDRKKQHSIGAAFHRIIKRNPGQFPFERVF